MPASPTATPLRVAICEDTDVEATILISYIETSNLNVQVERFASGEAFVEVFAADKYDLIFLDVYMGEMTGVQTAEKIREQDNQVVIVFTTTSEDFTREGYRLNAYKYMLKPVYQDDVVDALELATVKRDRAKEAALDIICDNQPISIPFSAIEFVESRNGKSFVVTQSGTQYGTIASLDSLEHLLLPPRFLRTHRAFIVNLDHVDDIDDDFIMDNGEIVYIRVKDHKRISHAYDDYLFNNVRSD
jgi:DNA-binding LytR/AlgR family response regulator